VRLAQPVIARIAADNAKRLAGGQSVPWFPGATIHDWGVELPNGWGGKIAVPWGELEEPEIVNGICRLRRVSKSVPIMRVNTFRMNFFPGLEIVRSRLAGFRYTILLSCPRSAWERSSPCE
jgi:hypothetical protein